MSIKPLEVQRDQYGYWSHPDYLAFCDGREFIPTAEFDQWMAQQLEVMAHQQCGKCKEQLPMQSCPCLGEAACWVTNGWKQTKLVI